MPTQNERIGTLIDLNEDLENYFANTIIPQFFVDAHLRLRKFTPPAMKQFKLTQGDIGKLWSEIPNQHRFPPIIRYIKHVIASKEILERDVHTPDQRWYQMNILPYNVRKENTTNGVIVTFIDITFRIRDLKEQERLTAENELLIDTIAHDVKNPLSALGMAIEMLKKPQKQDLLPVLIKNIVNSLEKMNKIFYDLVQSRWTGNRYDALDETLDLENVLNDVKHTLAQQIEESKAVFSTEVEGLEIVFQRRKLRSIMYNLVSNALKYSSPERIPEIHIRTHIEKGFIVITVSDNGIGIDPEHQGFIFEKCRQVDHNREGDGVGLYLVKEMLTRSGGKIIVESKLNCGTTFKVFLTSSER